MRIVFYKIDALFLTSLSHLGPTNANSMALLDLQYFENINRHIHEITTHLKFKCHPLFLPYELYITFANE